jgi:hypothetical protein
MCRLPVASLARKHTVDLARIGQNDNQIGNDSLLASDKRQAHQQMTMNRLPLDLDRKLSLRYVIVWLANMSAEFAQDFNKKAWHIEKVNGKYGIIADFRFSSFFPQRRLPCGEFENYSDRSITFNWIEVP